MVLNSCRVFSQGFRAFCQFLNSSSAYRVTGKTVKTITDQRNFSIIGILIHAANSNSHENLGILT